MPLSASLTDQNPNPDSLIVYARSFGLSLDHRRFAIPDLTLATADPFLYRLLSRPQTQTQAASNHGASPNLDTSAHDDFALLLSTANLETTRESDLPQLTASESQILSSAITPPEYALRPADWDAFLPISDRRRWAKMKMKEPLLRFGVADAWREFRIVKRGVDLLGVVEDLVMDVRDELGGDGKNRERKLEEKKERNLEKRFAGAEEEVHRLLKGEKLVVEKRVMQLVWRSIKCEKLGHVDYGLSVKDPWLDRGRGAGEARMSLETQDYEFEEEEDFVAEEAEHGGETQEFDGGVSENEGFAFDDDIAMFLNDEILEDHPATKDIQRAYGEETPNHGMVSKAPEAVVLPSDIALEDASDFPNKRQKLIEDIKIELTSYSSSWSVSEENIEGYRLDTDEGDRCAPDMVKVIKSEPWDHDEFPATEDMMELSGAKHTEIMGASDRLGDTNQKPVETSELPKKLVVPDIERYVPIWEPENQQRDQLINEHILNRLVSMEFRTDNEAGLNWTHFQPISPEEIMRKETIEISDSASRAILPPQKIVQSQQLLWKEPGLRILDRDWGDEDKLSVKSDFDVESTTDEEHTTELEAVAPSRTEQLTCISTIPKMTSSEHAGVKQSVSKLATPHLSSESNVAIPKNTAVPRVVDIERPQSTPAPAFSASESLSAFLDLRGLRFVKSKQVIASLAKEIAEDPIQSTQASQAGSEIESGITCPIQKQILPGSNPQIRLWTLPEAELLKRSRVIVINNHIFQSQPGLVSFLEEHTENLLRIIYRDFDDQIETAPDIILSPNTCLVFTDIQALTQKPLPGQKMARDASYIEQRVSRLTYHYDLVLVLVSIRSIRRDTLSPSDVTTLTKFTAACSSLSSSSNRVCACWHLYDTADNLRSGLNKAVWASIVEHAFPNAQLLREPKSAFCGISFIDEETLWELFLRKAQVNPLAAQLILGHLKRPPSDQFIKFEMHVDDDNSSSWGLGRLVRMDSQERIRMFTGIVGERSLRALSRALDGRVV